MRFSYAVVFIASQLLIVAHVISGALEYKYLTDKNEDRNVIDEGDTLEFSVQQSSKAALTGNVTCERDRKDILRLSKVSQTANMAVFKAKGKRLGRDHIKCHESTNEDDEITVEIAVIQKETTLLKLFTPFVFIMVAILNIVFGTEVTLKDLRFILFRPKPLIAAAICQFILLPPFGLALVKLMGYEADVGLGLLMVACAPGGGNSNAAAFLVDGEVPLSIAMTFFSTALAIGFMPLNIWIYARFASDDSEYSAENIPYAKLVGALVLIAVPVAIGMVMISKAEKFTKKLMRFAKPVVFLLLFVFIAFALYRNAFTFELMTWGPAIGACLFPFGGFFLGTIVSMVMRLRASQTKTIAFEVGMQNAGLVVGMALVVFDQPEADLNSIMPIYILIMTSVLSVPCFLLHYLVYKWSAKYRDICAENRKAQLRDRELFDKLQVEKEDMEANGDANQGEADSTTKRKESERI